MSTCKGAAPPHNDCVHGDRCDWVAPFTQQFTRDLEKQRADEIARLKSQYPNNRQGRRALERAMLKRGLA